MCIVGAGPAGAYLARLLADRGYAVRVYDVARRLGAKPCGWGVPYTVERLLRIPGEYVLSRVREYRVVVDWGFEVGLRARRTMGYIVDKPGLLGWLLEGVDARLGSLPRRGECGFTVYARGHAYYPGRKLRAVQVVARGWERGGEALALYFSGLVGYAWAFPLGGGAAKVGVGGFASWGALRSLLRGVLGRLGLRRVSGLEGAPIAAGGLALPRGRLSIGEEVGAVMPLTGEGIRPGFITAGAAAEAIVDHRDFAEALEATGLPWQLRVERALLRFLEGAGPLERRRLWERVDPRLVARLAAGDFTRGFLAVQAARHPSLLRVLGGLLSGSR